MLGTLLSQGFHHPARRDCDHLFAPFSPDGAPAQVLDTLYQRYADAFADETPPPQHVHFRALVAQILGAAPESLRDLHSLQLRRVNSAYVTCFEQAEHFEFQRALWRHDPPFRKSLAGTRERVIADLVARAAAEAARRKHFARWKECEAATVDIPGDAPLDQIKQMTPDDWHEVALKWNWDDGAGVLKWITAQRTCDRATAVYILCAGRPADIATGRSITHASFVRALAARLEGGYYPNADLVLSLPLRTQFRFAEQIAEARASGQSPWLLPDGLITHAGRLHQPKYSVSNGAVRYHYEYWLTHLAPRR
jgi:hypothetical protein